MVDLYSSSKKRYNGKTYEQIIEHIRAAISSGELRPGDRLPPEIDLAKNLGVSRPTVREALKVLEALNILESSTGPKGGTFVRNITGLEVAEYLKDSISLLLDVDELSLRELWAARETIDIPSAGMAAIRRTEQDLFVIERTIEADELKVGDTVVSNISFHRAVAEASKNRMLSLFMSSIHVTLKSLSDHYILPKDMLLEVKTVSQEAHRLIYEAIAAQDESEARERMQKHLRLSYGVYEQAIPRKTAKSAPNEQQIEGSYSKVT